MNLMNQVMKKTEQSEEEIKKKRKLQEDRRNKIWKEMITTPPCDNLEKIKDQEMVQKLQIPWRLQKIWSEMKKYQSWVEIEKNVRNIRDEEGQKLVDDLKKEWLNEMDQIQKQKEEEQRKIKEQEKQNVLKEEQRREQVFKDIKERLQTLRWVKCWNEVIDILGEEFEEKDWNLIDECCGFWTALKLKAVRNSKQKLRRPY